MKTVTFKKDHEFYSSGTTTTIDDTWADQLLKAKIVTLAKVEEATVTPSGVEGQNNNVSSSGVENNNPE